MEQFFAPLASAVVGGLLVWLGALLTDRRKFKYEQRGALRKAYSQWLAMYMIARGQIEDIGQAVGQFPNTIAEQQALIARCNDAIASTKGTLTPLSEILILERDADRREMLLGLSKLIEHRVQILTSQLETSKLLLDRQTRYNSLEEELAEIIHLETDDAAKAKYQHSRDQILSQERELQKERVAHIERIRDSAGRFESIQSIDKIVDLILRSISGKL